MDRPARKTKVVNYCEAKDFDDDEDFASVKAPPSKKAKEDVRQEQKKSSSKSSSQETNCQPTQSEKSRKPLDVKLYERDLEAAITLSSLNGTDELKEQSPTTRADAKVIIPIDENTDPASLHLSNCSVDVGVMGLDQITSEKGSLASARQKKSASKAAEVQRNTNDDEDDEDYQPKPAPDSESDEDFSEPADSEDEEFTLKKPSKAIKKEKIAKKDQTKPTSAPKKERSSSKASKSKSASTPVRSPPTTKVAPKRPSSSCSVPTSKSAACLSPPGGRIPKWTPPAQIGKSSTPSSSSAAKSPGPGLRLGLSRLVRVKPLHPSVTSH